MQREQIREQFSLLEEQLERLTSIAAPSSKKNREHELDVGEEDLLIARVKMLFDELHTLVREETLKQKSISAIDFTQKLIKILVQEAAQRNYDVAISYHSSGRISMEMVEVSMGAILSCFKAALKCFHGLSSLERTNSNLNKTFSLYLELHGHSDEFHFRLMHDGRSFEEKTDFCKDIEDQFEKVRAGLAKCGGWFSRKSTFNYGGQIEFKVPLPRTRQEVVILKKGNVEILIPCFFVVENTKDFKKIPSDLNTMVGVIDESSGIMPITGDPKSFGNLAVRVGVADFEAWIICDSVSERLKSRKYFAQEFLSNDSWFSYLGLCQQNGVSLSLPLLDGDALMQFYSRREKNEDI